MRCKTYCCAEEKGVFFHTKPARFRNAKSKLSFFGEIIFTKLQSFLCIA